MRPGAKTGLLLKDSDDDSMTYLRLGTSGKHDLRARDQLHPEEEVLLAFLSPRQSTWIRNSRLYLQIKKYLVTLEYFKESVTVVSEFSVFHI